MATGDFQFNFTNLNPLNTSGWSTSALATRIKAMQDAQKVKDAEDAANASVYGHAKGGKGGKKQGALDMGGLVAGGLAGGPLGAIAGGFGGGLLGGSDPRTPAEKLAHQTKMLAKQEKKFDKTAADLAGEQADVDALNEAISKATDPSVIENLTKDLEQAQKKLGKVQKKHDANKSHVDEVKKKVTGLDPNAAAKLDTKENYFNEIVDKKLASRTGASGWHGTGVTTGGTDGTNVKLDPITGEPVVTTPPPVDDKGRVIADPLYTGDVPKGNVKQPAGVAGGWDFTSGTPVFTPQVGTEPSNTAAIGLPQNHVGKFLKQQAKILGVKPGQFKKQVKSGWGSAPVIT